MNEPQLIYPFYHGWAYELCLALINRATVDFLVLVCGASVDLLGVHPGWKAGPPASAYLCG